MPMVHRILITLRTLMEDDPQPPAYKRRRPNNGNRANNRSRQTTALVLTFRDIFCSGGLNIILDEVEVNRRPSRRSSRAPSISSRAEDSVPKSILCSTSHSTNSFGIPREQNIPVITPFRLNCEDETVPLLQEGSPVIPCTDMVVSPMPFSPKGILGKMPAIVRKKKKPENLTVPLNPTDETKTVETLRKVLKWSPRKQNSAKFAVTLPTEEKHTALAVVENAVNTVKEEQIRKKKRKFKWLKFC